MRCMELYVCNNALLGVGHIWDTMGSVRFWGFRHCFEIIDWYTDYLSHRSSDHQVQFLVKKKFN